MEMIPFTRCEYTQVEKTEVVAALDTGRLEGDGIWTKKVQADFEKREGLAKTLFTTSCTDAMELSALLFNVGPGDEVILPSYTFTSTAHAFALRGAKIVFADSSLDHPNLDANLLESLITKSTKAIVPVHYAGIACDMDMILDLAQHHQLLVMCDAAQAIESRYKKRPISQFGDLSAFSFHQTKNISCGEGGLLAFPTSRFADRAEIIREKGTNRAAFFRGQVDKYTCVDIGSSFLGSELNASLLWAQLQRREEIQKGRHRVWNAYQKAFGELQDVVQLPVIKPHCEHNAHCYYLVCRSLEERTALMQFLKENQIQTVFHYISLHSSPFYQPMHDGRKLKQSDRYTDCLVRLPLFATLTEDQVDHVIRSVKKFFHR